MQRHRPIRSSKSAPLLQIQEAETVSSLWQTRRIPGDKPGDSFKLRGKTGEALALPDLNKEAAVHPRAGQIQLTELT